MLGRFAGGFGFGKYGEAAAAYNPDAKKRRAKRKMSRKSRKINRKK